MANETVRVSGYRELMRSLQHAEKDVRTRTRKRLRELAGPVRDSARSKLGAYSERSASKLGISVRQRGVSVEQRLRKTTGKRPDFGSLQMRKALLPALGERASEIEHGLEKVLDDVINANGF